MPIDVNELFDILPAAKAFDLRAMMPFVENGFSIMEELLGERKKELIAAGELYEWRKDAFLADEVLTPRWISRMLEIFPESDFRSLAPLFLLHQRSMIDSLPTTTRACTLTVCMRIALETALSVRYQSDRFVFSDRDRVVQACDSIALALTMSETKGWESSHQSERISLEQAAYGLPEGEELLRPLCRQIAHRELWIRANGTFSVRESPPAAPYALRVDGLSEGWQRNLRSLLINAMAREWITVEQAEGVITLDSVLEPWWLLAATSSELDSTQGFLPEFARRLRKRFPAALDVILARENGFPEEWINLHPDQMEVPGCHFERACWPTELRGSAGLLAVARWIKKYPKRLANTSTLDGWGLMIWRLAFVQGLDSDEDSETVVAELRGFQSPALMNLLPWSGAAQSLVLQALRLSSLEPLRGWMVAHVTPKSPNKYAQPNGFLRNDPDPSKGVIDLASLKEALRDVSSRDCKALVDAYVKVGMMEGLDKVLSAVTGATDRGTLVHAAADKAQQPAMKLLGLLPVADADDVRQRYLILQKLYKEASKHGAQRQATQRAAALAGLANLAQVGGYQDSGELEWAMECGEGPTVLASLIPQQIGDYQAWIEIAGFAAELRFRNAAGKVLGSAPTAIKREPALMALKEKLAEFREQFRRFGRLMETRMVGGAPLALTQLRAALAHPIMAPIVAGLVWLDDVGTLGLLGEEGLVGPDGTYAAAGTVLRLAHPVSLLQRPDGPALLSRWQRWLFEQQRVQPFKQLFRETYVPTPAEVEAEDGLLSSRYAGRRILTGIAQGLFQARGWIPFNEDECWSLTLADGLSASCGYAVGHYFTEQPEGDLLQVDFEHHGQRVPLLNVPSAFFSEVMRDLDLVVTIAMPEGSDENHERLTSSASIAVRADLLRAIAPSLGDQVIEVHERDVLVRGHLGNYRVHLASGHVYVEPGTYVCIIPASTAGRNPIRLPFAEQDLKTSEIVSKVMLLVHDDKIKDQSILRQISRTKVADE